MLQHNVAAKFTWSQGGLSVLCWSKGLTVKNSLKSMNIIVMRGKGAKQAHSIVMLNFYRKLCHR